MWMGSLSLKEKSILSLISNELHAAVLRRFIYSDTSANEDNSFQNHIR
jgi:hypothetical protein